MVLLVASQIKGLNAANVHQEVCHRLCTFVRDIVGAQVQCE